MKNTHLFFVLVLLLIFEGRNTLFGQNNCTQPNNNIHWKVDGVNTKFIIECNSFQTYNCHGFGMSYWENNCINPPSWDNNNIVQSSYSCLGTFGNDGPDYRFDQNYLELCNTNDSHLIYYSFAGAGDHTAIREILPNNGSIKYLSKYGPDGPVIGHELNETWYHLTNASENAPKEYWRYLGNDNIAGSTIISGTSGQVYTFPSISGVNYTWTIVSNGASSAYVSAGQNSNQVTITPTHSGTITLKLTLDTSCGDTRTKTLDINIQTNICLEGSYINNGSSPKPMFTANSVGVGSVTTSISCPSTS